MIDRSPAPEKIPPGRPGQLLLRTGGACDLDPAHLLKVWARQRHRFAVLLRGFGPDDWAAPTRCTNWCAQDVVRHLCDCTALGVSAGPGDRTLDLAAGFDPRITPRGWPAVSASEPPEATLSHFLATSDHLFARLRGRLARGIRFEVCLPYGPMDWTVFMLHGFWDSWLHERDVLLARGREHPPDGDATRYAAAYGLFIAAAVASMLGGQVQETLALGGDGGGVFGLEAHGTVTLTVTRETTTGPPADQVADALAGRAPIPAILGDLPASSRAALSRLADFFNTPAGHSPA